MIILNLGCGTKTSNHPSVINIDWSAMLRIRRSWVLGLFRSVLLNRTRLESFEKLQSNIMVHDISKGIPFENNSVDVVYHSHFLEHLDRDVSARFLGEVKRVLKRNGIQRIVVPDLEYLCREYLTHIDLCLTVNASEDVDKHDDVVSALLEQSVRREAFGTSRQRPFRRYVENLLLGDARKRGETHQWMYDRVNLPHMLISSGFRKVYIQKYNTSVIPGWNEIGLDLEEMGKEYKPNSMYIEAVG